MFLACILNGFNFSVAHFVLLRGDMPSKTVGTVIGPVGPFLFVLVFLLIYGYSGDLLTEIDPFSAGHGLVLNSPNGQFIELPSSEDYSAAGSAGVSGVGSGVGVSGVDSGVASGVVGVGCPPTVFSSPIIYWLRNNG